MTNREELEKMFDEELYNCDCRIDLDSEGLKEIKSVIFETIIPKVLNSILPRFTEDMHCYINIKEKEKGYSETIRKIQLEAKSLYGIDL